MDDCFCLCTSGILDFSLTSDQPSPGLVELEEMPNDLISDPDDVSGLLLWALWRPFSALIVSLGLLSVHLACATCFSMILAFTWTSFSKPWVTTTLSHLSHITGAEIKRIAFSLRQNGPVHSF